MAASLKTNNQSTRAKSATRQESMKEIPKTQEEIDDIYDALMDVHHLDGTVTPLVEAPAKGRQARALTPVPKRVTRGLGKATVAKQKGAGHVGGDAQKVIDAAKKKAADAKQAAKDKAAKERVDAAKKKADDKAAALDKKKAEHEAEVAKRKAERDADAVQRKADRERAVGETGVPEEDAAFHAAVDEARALAVRIYDPSALNIPFLSRPGVDLRPTGLILPAGVPLLEWVDGMAALKGMGDLSTWATGDALVYGEGAYGKQYRVTAEALGLKPSTIKGYVNIARAFALEDRVPGASPTMHLVAASLYRKNPALARNVLEEAVATGQTKDWVAAQVRELQAEPGVPTKQEAAVAKRDALVNLSTAQREADLQKYDTEEEYNVAVREELVAVTRHAQDNMSVPAEATLRCLAYLQAQLTGALQAMETWKARALQAEGELGSRADAQARVSASVANSLDGIDFLKELGIDPSDD